MSLRIGKRKGRVGLALVILPAKVTAELAQLFTDVLHQHALVHFRADVYTIILYQLLLFRLARLVFFAQPLYLVALTLDPSVRDDDVYLGCKGVTQERIDIYGRLITSLYVWARALMRLVGTVEFVYRCFPMMRNGGKLVVVHFRQAELRIYLVRADSVCPSPHSHVVEIRVLYQFPRHVLACGGQSALRVLHHFKTCHGHHAQPFPACKPPLDEEISEVIIVDDARLAELLHTGHPVGLPRV